MKKLLVMSCLLLGTITTFAQLPGVKLGAKTGVSLASLKGHFAEESNRLGYQAGIWIRFGGAGIYVQPEGYLASKGGEFGRIKQNGNTYEGSGKIDFTTIDVPVLFGKKFGAEKLNFRLMAGPVMSFVLDKNFKENYDVVTDFNNYKNQTLGLQYGAGVDLGNLSFDLRYESGLTNIEKSGKYDQRQNLWHISIGYALF